MVDTGSFPDPQGHILRQIICRGPVVDDTADKPNNSAVFGQKELQEARRLCTHGVMLEALVERSA